MSADDVRPHAVAVNHVATHYLMFGVERWDKMRAEARAQADRVGGEWAAAYLRAVEAEIAHYAKHGGP